MAIKYCQAAEDKVLATEAAQGLLRDRTEPGAVRTLQATPRQDQRHLDRRQALDVGDERAREAQ